MQRVDFSYNWNGKLGNKYFTTLRRWQPQRFILNSLYECYFEDRHLFDIQLVAAEVRSLAQFTESESMLDTGYPLEKLPEILAKMYPNYKGDFGLYLFRNVDYKNAAPANDSQKIVSLKAAYKRLTAQDLTKDIIDFPEDGDNFLFETITNCCFAYSANIIADGDNVGRIEATNRKILALISYQIGLATKEVLQKAVLHINYCRTHILADFNHFNALPLLFA